MEPTDLGIGERHWMDETQSKVGGGLTTYHPNDEMNFPDLVRTLWGFLPEHIHNIHTQLSLFGDKTKVSNWEGLTEAVEAQTITEPDAGTISDLWREGRLMDGVIEKDDFMRSIEFYIMDTYFPNED